jgi:hypothetical protein
MEYAVKSLSPAYWYVCDVQRAKASKCRAQVSPSFASKAEADAWMAKRLSPHP